MEINIMQKTKPQMTFYLIHHSHTDIGYTETQKTIETWHVDFIYQAMDYIEQSRDEIDQDFSGFKWNCETFWVVEKFLEIASEKDISRFVACVKNGEIGISANYLNNNELLGMDCIGKALDRAEKFAEKHQVKIQSAMTADINGHSWGFAQALVDRGINFLSTNVHTHHGLFPLFKKQTPFYWETPKQDKLLVWSGDHYVLGSDLGMVPTVSNTYFYDNEQDKTFKSNWEMAEERIPKYAAQLANEEYPFDFVPVMASGVFTDNSPPSVAISGFIKKWNKQYGEQFKIEMLTLDQLATKIREQVEDIPVYRGEWPDWWSDGSAGCPAYTKVFKKAQRKLGYFKALDSAYPSEKLFNTKDIENDLVLYSEHTFNHSESVTRPWNILSTAIGTKKKSFAVNAFEKITALTDEKLLTIGASRFTADRDWLYKVVNPFTTPMKGIVNLTIDYFDYIDLKIENGVDVIDLKNGQTIKHNQEPASRGKTLSFYYELAPHEEVFFKVERKGGESNIQPLNEHLIGVDISESDICDDSATFKVSPGVIETPYVVIRWEEGQGITSFYDKIEQLEMINPDSPHGLLSPVYEISPTPDLNSDGVIEALQGVRRMMGRNRKSQNVERYVGQLCKAELPQVDHCFARVNLKYSVKGIKYYNLEIKAYLNESRVDFNLTMQKESEWAPENVYLPIPLYNKNDQDQLFIDKPGVISEPWVDQLPGTLTDFYSIQEGFCISKSRNGIAVSTPDTNLLQLGDIDFKPRVLMGQEALKNETIEPYIWLMNNFWETNFDVDLGGFYEFEFFIALGSEFKKKHHAIEKCRAMNTDILAFRANKPVD